MHADYQLISMWRSDVLCYISTGKRQERKRKENAKIQRAIEKLMKSV